MRRWQLAREVLAEAGESMSSREIWNRIESGGRYGGRGSNPDATLRTELARKTVGRTESWTNHNKVFQAEAGNPTRWGLVEWLEKAHITATPKPTSGRNLKIKDESDLETVFDALNFSKKRCHNQLTNQLLEWATAAGVVVKEETPAELFMMRFCSVQRPQRAKFWSRRGLRVTSQMLVSRLVSY